VPKSEHFDGVFLLERHVIKVLPNTPEKDAAQTGDPRVHDRFADERQFFEKIECGTEVFNDAFGAFVRCLVHQAAATRIW